MMLKCSKCKPAFLETIIRQRLIYKKIFWPLEIDQTQSGDYQTSQLVKQNSSQFLEDYVCAILHSFFIKKTPIKQDEMSVSLCFSEDLL